MANVGCPNCRGEQGGFSIACSPGKCRSAIRLCDFCKGAGEVSSEANARWQKGRALREARVAQGNSQREQAHLLGINWIDLNAAEHGRLALEQARRARCDERE